jgi:hypothetical protein
MLGANDGDDMNEMTYVMMRKPCLIIGLIGVFTLLVTGAALAASTDGPRQPVAGAGLFIAFAIAYLSRRRAMGGWLLYFYIQLYLSLSFSLIFVPQVLANLNPSQWDNSFLYVMFFLSVVPVLITEVIEVFAATRLLLRRNERNVKFLRNALLALVATSAIALAIDVAYFKDPALFFDILMFVFATIWALYFSKSRRVKLVFIERNWVYTAYSQRRVLTPEDKKRLRKRAFIASSATFVAFLLLMGSVLKGEGKQPDMGLFAVPLFYALVAAIIAWYLPIRRSKPISDEDIRTNAHHDT